MPPRVPELKCRPVGTTVYSIQSTLAGKKDVTRRVIPEVAPGWVRAEREGVFWTFHYKGRRRPIRVRCIYGEPGDYLWCKEAHFVTPEGKVLYRADGHPEVQRWRAGRWMRREYARLFLRVEDIQAERLHDITEASAEAEGMVRATKDGTLYKWGWDELPWQDWPRTAREAYLVAWDWINAARGYPASGNPSVFALRYSVVQDGPVLRQLRRPA